ncbi:MAG TPA: hypothetical protein PKN50_17440 [Spirochaetota bacterium]|nr:hypothetical protein [Spirochaetota bacterium]HPV42591.1 hypothetical protein [Spirochaetota bacterium]
MSVSLIFDFWYFPARPGKLQSFLSLKVTWGKNEKEKSLAAALRRRVLLIYARYNKLIPRARRLPLRKASNGASPLNPKKMSHGKGQIVWKLLKVINSLSSSASPRLRENNFIFFWGNLFMKKILAKCKYFLILEHFFIIHV